VNPICRASDAPGAGSVAQVFQAAEVPRTVKITLFVVNFPTLVKRPKNLLTIHSPAIRHRLRRGRQPPGNEGEKCPMSVGRKGPPGAALPGLSAAKISGDIRQPGEKPRQKARVENPGGDDEDAGCRVVRNGSSNRRGGGRGPSPLPPPCSRDAIRAPVGPGPRRVIGMPSTVPGTRGGTPGCRARWAP